MSSQPVYVWSGTTQTLEISLRRKVTKSKVIYVYATASSTHWVWSSSELSSELMISLGLTLEQKFSIVKGRPILKIVAM